MPAYELKSISEMPSYGDDWTEANQQRMYEWKSEALTLARLHYKKMTNQRTIFLVIKPAAILCSVLTATALSFSDRYPAMPFADVAILISALASLANGFDFLVGPQECYLQHKQAKCAYMNVVRTIEYMCTLPPQKRPDVEVAYVLVTGEMNNIETNAPPIPMASERSLKFPEFEQTHRKTEQ